MKKLLKMVLSVWCLVLGAEARTAADLPAGYTAVDYIVAPNGAYIDTGYKPNQNTHVVMDVTVQGALEYWFGCWTNDYNRGAFALGNDGEYGIYYAIGDDGGSFKKVDGGQDGRVPDGRQTVEVTPWEFKVNAVTWTEKVESSRKDFHLDEPLYLFAQNRKGKAFVNAAQGDIICHGCKIYEGSDLVRDFVPCVRKSDQVVGLYDLAESDPGKAFYANKGSGAFGVPVVRPTATITKIANRYPWNGKIDVEYELRGVGSSFGQVGKLVTKFVSGGVEKAETTYLTDAELKGGCARRTFDFRELFGENKRDAQAQASARLTYDYAVIDVSGGPNTNFYPVTYYKSEPTGGWNTDEYKTSKIVLYCVNDGKYWGNQKTEQTTAGFWIGVFEITDAQYAKVMGGDADGKTPKACVSYATLRGTNEPNATVTGDSFLKRLCDRTGLDGFDLPTESQWEIACRAGTTSDYYWGDSTKEAGEYMWYFDGFDDTVSAQEVGKKKPNAWGLYDMAGNVCEWCRDFYHWPRTVGSSADVCIVSADGSGKRVKRGGSYYTSASNGGSSYCYNCLADADGDAVDLGFRLARSGSDGVWTTGQSFSFDTRAEKTIAGTEAETFAYSGDNWGAGGSGVTVGYSLEGGETIELKTATDSGTVSWKPTLNGRYEFRHIVTDGTTETAVFIVNGLPGGEGDPWGVGEGVTAYVKDRVLYLQGEGEVTEFGGDGAPWTGYGETLEGAYLARRVKVPASVLATMPFSVKGGEPVLPEGTIPVSKVALEKAGVETLAIEDGTAYLGISVRTNGDLTAETASWGKVKFDEKTPVGVSEDGTALLIPVPANAKSGFMTLWSGEATKAQGVQLWAGGPFWAECNVGAEQPGDYGTNHKFQDAQTAVSAPWRVPTKDEMNGPLAK